MKVDFTPNNALMLLALRAEYMWITQGPGATMAADFCLVLLDLGDVRVCGTLAAVCRAFAR
jgi:hypothetical protein